MTIANKIEKQIIKCYTENRMKCNSILFKYNICIKTLYNILHRNNIKLKQNYNEKQIIGDYIGNKMTCKEITSKYNIGSTTLYRILHRNNISIKEPKIPHIKKNYINKQILYGSLLGDGCVSKRNIFEEGHCMAQEKYISWKNKYLNIRFGYSNNKGYKQCYIRSAKNDNFIKRLRKLFYPNGIKVVTRGILDNIDELALLVWYLDDGTYNKRDKSITLCTHYFTYDEHLVMKDWFENKWKIKCIIRKQKNYFALSFPVLSTRKLLDILKPIFVKYGLPKCMRYKLGEK